jgi:cellulose synthase/poly-beta-1,6-N-acetylglucosamine synthase-like glycosyltransferase
MKLPKHIRIVVVPNSQPKTKPKACNYGLAFAKGEYLVIYDAEDLPEVDQLKKAYFAFQKVPKNVICLQAKLNYYNPNQNLLTRFFTAEYSLWFDVTLTGYQSINTSIPLGGTSNHFRTKDLMSLEGWDPFNVTEDADLGVRLFKAGYRTAIIDSTTYEEANSKWGNWVRQRSRWIKGYMQTYLVHTRNPLDFIKSSKEHSFLFNLIFGGKISFILINPFLWLATISYFCLYSIVGPTIERLYPGLVFYMAAFSLVFGNFLSLYYYMVGAMKRKQYGLIKYTFLIPFYWLMISIAGFLALYQLFFKPFYWEKTVHGLHLKKAKVSKREFNIPKIILIPVRYGMSLFV